MYKYCVSKKIVKNPLRCVNKIIISNIGYESFLNNLLITDSIESILKEEKYTYIELINLNNEDVNYIVNLVSDYVECVDIFNSDYDLFSLGNCSKLKEVKLHCLSSSSLWDLKNNKELVSLSLVDLYNLNDVEGIRNSSLVNFEIKKDYKTIPSVLDIKIKDFDVFKSLSNLKNLSLFNDNKEELKILSKLVNLEKLNLPKDYFTFEEFSYLKSKLINISNLNAIYHIAKDPSNEKVYYIVIGKDKDDFVYYEDKDYNVYIDEYNELVNKYKEVIL